MKKMETVPGVGNYPITLGRAHFPIAKGSARGGDHLPNKELPDSQVWWM